MTQSKRVQRQINRYLTRVGRALEHLEPGERREILEDLRAHIHEGLAQRASTSPSVEDVKAVLSSMEVPQAYRADPRADDSTRAARSRTLGRLAFYVFVGAAGVTALAFLLGATVSGALFRGGLILGGVAALCALGLGIAGWRDPYGKAAVICAVLALACATLFLPAGRTTTGPSAPQPTVETQGGPAE